MPWGQWHGDFLPKQQLPNSKEGWRRWGRKRERMKQSGRQREGRRERDRDRTREGRDRETGAGAGVRAVQTEREKKKHYVAEPCWESDPLIKGIPIWLWTA